MLAWHSLRTRQYKSAFIWHLGLMCNCFFVNRKWPGHKTVCSDSRTIGKATMSRRREWTTWCFCRRSQKEPLWRTSRSDSWMMSSTLTLDLCWSLSTPSSQSTYSQTERLTSTRVLWVRFAWEREEMRKRKIREWETDWKRKNLFGYVPSIAFNLWCKLHELDLNRLNQFWLAHIVCYICHYVHPVHL